MDQFIETLQQMVSSHLHELSLLLAVYSTMRAVMVFTQTPALLTHNENSEVSNSRQRLFALHGLTLALRWGYFFFFIIAQALAKISVHNAPGGSLSSYLYGLYDMKFDLLLTPLEVSYQAIDRSVSTALLALGLITPLFDHVLTNAFWSALIASSSKYQDGDESPELLFNMRPFADIFSRGVAYTVDCGIALIAVLVLMRVEVVQLVTGQILSLIPTSLSYHSEFISFVLTFLVVASFMRVISCGASMGRQLVGIQLTQADGTPLTLASAVGREIAYFSCHAYIPSLFISLLNEEQATCVDFVSGTRDVDVMVHHKNMNPNPEIGVGSFVAGELRERKTATYPTTTTTTTTTDAAVVKTPKPKKQPAASVTPKTTPKVKKEPKSTAKKSTKKQTAAAAAAAAAANAEEAEVGGAAAPAKRGAAKVKFGGKRRVSEQEEEEQEEVPVKSARKSAKKTPAKKRVLEEEETPKTATRAKRTKGVVKEEEGW